MPEKTKQQKLDQALRLHQSGKKMQEILEAVEMNYSQVWLFITDAELPDSERIKEKDRTPATVRSLRDDSENSWGMIQVRFGYREFSEGAIRKMYEEASGDRSIGLRIGRGGRFLNGDPVLYLDERRQPGIRISKDTPRSELTSISAGLRGGGNPQKVSAAKKAVGAVKKAGGKKPTKAVSKKALARKKASNG